MPPAAEGSVESSRASSVEPDAAAGVPVSAPASEPSGEEVGAGEGEAQAAEEPQKSAGLSGRLVGSLMRTSWAATRGVGKVIGFVGDSDDEDLIEHEWD